jgi:hypothetical protein
MFSVTCIMGLETELVYDELGLPESITLFGALTLG